MDPVSGKKSPQIPQSPTLSAPKALSDEEEVFDAVEPPEQAPPSKDVQESDSGAQTLKALAPRSAVRSSTGPQPLLPPVISHTTEKKPYRKYRDDEVLQEIHRAGLKELIKQPSNDLEFLSAERLLQEMAVLAKPRQPASTSEASRHDISSASVEILSTPQALHSSEQRLADTWAEQGLYKIFESFKVEEHALSAQRLLDDIFGFEAAAAARKGKASLFLAHPSPNGATGVFPIAFQPGTPSHASLRKGEVHNVSGSRVYTLWRDHMGILRTAVPATGTDTGKAISKIKAGEQGMGRRIFRAFSMNRTVKFPFFPVNSTELNGKKHTHIGGEYNAHFAPLRPETYDALVRYTEKDYDEFEEAVLNHDAVTKDLLDALRDGPIFSEAMIKSILRKTSERNCKNASDGFFTYKRAAKAFCHYLRNISVRKNRTAFHLVHGQWENLPVYTNPAYAELVQGRNAQHGLQRTIDSILFENSFGSLIDNIHGAAIRSAVVVAGMRLCAEMTDFENRQHMDNVVQTVGTICSLISGALSAAPFVAVGAVASGILEPLQTAIIKHKASRFEEGRMREALDVEIHASLLSPANSGTRVPGLKEAVPGLSPLPMAERAHIGAFFVSQYKEMIAGI